MTNQIIKLKKPAWSHHIYSGRGRITESVIEGPTNKGLAYYTVRMDERETGKLLRVTKTDSMGKYLFDKMSLDVLFLIYALDRTGTYDAVTADRVTAALPE